MALIEMSLAQPRVELLVPLADTSEVVGRGAFDDHRGGCERGSRSGQRVKDHGKFVVGYLDGDEREARGAGHGDT